MGSANFGRLRRGEGHSLLSADRGGGRYITWRKDNHQIVRGHRGRNISSSFKGPANDSCWQTGHSVLLHVTDFLHYLYVAAPVNFVKTDIDGFKAYLETQLAQHQSAIHSVQMSMRENLFGFQGNQKSPYLKITVTDPKYINKLRTTIESGNMNYKQMWKGVDGGILTFDSIQYVLRFMIDTGVSLIERCTILNSPNTGHRNVLGGSPQVEIPYDTSSRPAFKLPNRGICAFSRSNSSP